MKKKKTQTSTVLLYAYFVLRAKNYFYSKSNKLKQNIKYIFSEKLLRTLPKRFLKSLPNPIKRKEFNEKIALRSDLMAE